jgi:two-component sensor histidine kinase
VINELVTNAVEHGLADRSGTVWLTADRFQDPSGTAMLEVTVEDDGVGLPTASDRHEGLGLQIVRTLVTSELGGTIEWGERDGGGTCVRIVLRPSRH